MPITIKQNLFKYKNPTTGQYQSIDAVTDATTSERIASIEAVGADVLNSIPADYSVIASRPNPNLLDNWYFVGGGSQQGGGQLPINQRGSTSLTSGGTYFIDRWKKTTGTSATIALDSTGLYSSTSTQGFIRQALHNKSELVGNTLTYSILYDDNELKTITHVLESANGRFYTNQDRSIAYANTGTSLTDEVVGFYCPYNSHAIAVKLEVGSGQTLVRKVGNNWVLNDSVPNYDMEFLKCLISTADSGDTYANCDYGTISRVKSHELLVHTGTTASELGRATLVVCGKLFIVHGVITVTQALSNGTILYDLPNYSYGMPNASNNPVIAADNASYTTVGVDNTAKTIKVTYNGGMQTGRFEIFLMGWIN